MRMLEGTSISKISITDISWSILGSRVDLRTLYRIRHYIICRRRWHLAATILLALMAASSGCTTVSISESDGHVRVERAFGFVTIVPEVETEPLVMKINALGFMSSPLGISMGYAAQSLAMLPSECRVVLWVDESIDIELLRTHLVGLQGVCALQSSEYGENQ